MGGPCPYVFNIFLIHCMERGSRDRSQRDHITFARRPPIVQDTHDNTGILHTPSFPTS